jgi:ribosomal protein S6--L-glutamate ligase
MTEARDSSPSPAPFVVGWEEWLALPDLGLPAIRAKIDTGAKTSALHAFAIEPYGPATAPMVRFGVHPIPGREDIVRFCTAAIADRRHVTSSNGETEARYVIRTRLVLGDRDWGEIEATLANRESMAYRMLLGRQAIRGGLLVDPAASFVQPRLSHRLYDRLPRQAPPARSLRIALIATKPTRVSNVTLKSEAEARGHTLDILPLDTLTFDYADPLPRILASGVPLPAYDAVIARTTGGPPGLTAAVVAHLQASGVATLNTSGAIERLRNPHLVAARLHAHGLPLPVPPVEPCEGRVLVVLGAAVASQSEGGLHLRLAERTASALGLGLAAIDLAKFKDGWKIAAIDPSPPLTGYSMAGLIARAIIVGIETRIRTPAVVVADATDGDV